MKQKAHGIFFSTFCILLILVSCAQKVRFEDQVMDMSEKVTFLQIEYSIESVEISEKLPSVYLQENKDNLKMELEALEIAFESDTLQLEKGNSYVSVDVSIENLSNGIQTIYLSNVSLLSQDNPLTVNDWCILERAQNKYGEHDYGMIQLLAGELQTFHLLFIAEDRWLEQSIYLQINPEGVNREDAKSVDCFCYYNVK